ncbi:polyamine ABC transporter substrate-binding protein [Alteromonas sp. C1M14]|nr:polyamine ABC transporter substrate-binding protein [Alteromonas sp. C1M14]
MPMFLAVLVIACSAISWSRVAVAKHVNVYNWNHYIGENVLSDFEKTTGIRVIYDLVDSNQVLEGKLLAGQSGYDVVVSSADFMARQIKAGIYLPLDKTQLADFSQLDPMLMTALGELDPNNQYGVPYMWGTTGIGFNRSKVLEVLGEDAPLDSWELVFNPQNLAKLSTCGVAFLDSPTDIFPLVLNYLGLPTHSNNPKNYQGQAKQLLMRLAPHITYFHSSKYIDDLATGEICVVVGWSGDILQAKISAASAAQPQTIEYIIPKEGALMWVDMLGIPSDAKNPQEALAFIKFMMRPDIAARNTNDIWYANPITASRPMTLPIIANDTAIYPTKAQRENLFPARPINPRVDRVINRAWTEILTGQ